MSRWERYLPDGSKIKVSRIVLDASVPEDERIPVFSGSYRCHRCNGTHEAQQYCGKFTRYENNSEGERVGRYDGSIKFPVMKCGGNYIVPIESNKV